MKHRLLNILGLVVLGLVAFDASRVEAQTVAPGPYYATPSWDQTLACTTPSSCPRFIVLSNFSSAAVLDRETGLVWERYPSNQNENWLTGQTGCNVRTWGNRLGWRLPTLQELASLIDPTESTFALPAGNPFQLQLPAVYWTATTNADNTGAAWAVSFNGNGSIVVFFKTAPTNAVWCVRGGQGVDPQ